MPRKYSLNKKIDFDKIFKQGKRVKSPIGTILFTSSEDKLDYPRFGLMVSKKISLKAVVRNKIKRQIKEVLRKNITSIKPYDYVIIPYSQVKDTEFNIIERSLTEAFQKIY